MFAATFATATFATAAFATAAFTGAVGMARVAVGTTDTIMVVRPANARRVAPLAGVSRVVFAVTRATARAVTGMAERSPRPSGIAMAVLAGGSIVVRRHFAGMA